jgi:signal transduction histidine kinase
VTFLSTTCVRDRQRIDVPDRGPGGDARTPSGDPIEGSGLGLAIAQRALERAGGSIDIESEAGKGTRVRLTLPAAA